MPYSTPIIDARITALLEAIGNNICISVISFEEQRGFQALHGAAVVDTNPPSEGLIASLKNQSPLLTGLLSENAPAPFGVNNKNRVMTLLGKTHE